MVPKWRILVVAMSIVRVHGTNARLLIARRNFSTNALRSVEASFSTVHYNAAAMSGTAARTETLSNEDEDGMKMIAER
jgi:hypothetical protein